MTSEHRLMSFGEHLDDLRRRLSYALAGVVVLFIVGLVFGSSLLEFLAAPLITALKSAHQPPALLATSPLEGFGAYIKVATIAALLASMPWILYQAWLFIAPGLFPNERRFVYFLLPLSGALTGVGIAVLYYIILPVSLFFLINFGAGLIADRATAAPLPTGAVLASTPVLAADPPSPTPGQWWVNSSLGQVRICVSEGKTMGVPLVGGGLIAQQYRISEYVNLVFMLGLAFALAFQVPLILLLLAWVGMVRPQDLARYRKQVIFGCVVGAALLPTQDPWSLILLSGLLYGLFEFGIVLMRFVPARRVAAGFGLVNTPPSRTDGAEEA